MSFWNFMGGFALFSLICDIFSGKSGQPDGSMPYLSRSLGREDYSGYDSADTDELWARMDDLQSRLDDCGDCDIDDMQDELDDIRDELDELDELDLERDLDDDW